MKIIQSAAIAMLLIGLAILLYFLNKAGVDGYVISNKIATNYTVSGQFGDFVGGVVGTFFALSGTLLIFLNFREQTKENKRSGFESSFFEMMRLYRENVSEMKYRKPTPTGTLTYENRQVLREITKEFIECYRDVKKFSDSENLDTYFNPPYAKKLKKIATKINPEINLIEMAIIDLAFMIVFYGVNWEGDTIIKDNVSRKYKKNYYPRLLHYIQLKPKNPNTPIFEDWSTLRSLHSVEFHKLINDLYISKNDPKNIRTPYALAKKFTLDTNYERYYDGHQFRLGHYFRHLHQSYKYLNNHPDLTEKEKYEYGKLYRAQLSTDEQILLFVNSISSLGMNWELTFKNI